MSKRVLIIDDEPEIRRNITFGLTQEGFTCVACPDGISAIHELNHAREKGIGYDYLITDIFMPDIDGLKILKVIKNTFPDVPVLVITGFGNEVFRQEALEELNTGYLDKPFEISELVAALEQLSAICSTLEEPKVDTTAEVGGLRESVSAYLTIRITDDSRAMEIFNELRGLEGVQACEAVRGDFDIIIFAQATSQAGIQETFDRVRKTPGVEVASVSPVERPKLDRDISEFISVYRKAVKKPEEAAPRTKSGTTSYIIVDIDKDAIQQIFTTVFFIDDVIFCDVIDKGTKLVGLITNVGAVGKTHRVIEKLNQIDGVLRVREAVVIRMADV
jgi:two-component system cell cycle response regulator CpdR